MQFFIGTNLRKPIRTILTFFKVQNANMNDVYWDQIDTDINKVMNFGDFSHKTVEMPTVFCHWGQKWPTPVGIGFMSYQEL